MDKVFISMKRLLGFTGASISSISETNDGYVFDCVLDSEPLRIFVTRPIDSPRSFFADLETLDVS